MELLKVILKNQTIGIDSHTKGDNLPLEWGKALHLHKHMNRKNTNVEVLIYIAADRDLEFRNSKNPKEEAGIVNEIKRAFKKKKIQQDFVRGFYETLDTYMIGLQIKDEQTRISNMLNAAKRFANLFGIETNSFACLDYFKKKGYIKKDDDYKNNVEGRKYIFYDKNEKIYVRIDDDNPTSFIIGYNLNEVKKFD